jgi:hypothetical protein
MKPSDFNAPIEVPPSSRPVQTGPQGRQPVRELSKPPATQQPKRKNWKEKVRDVAVPIAEASAVVAASSVGAPAQQVPAIAAPMQPRSPADLGTLGQLATPSQSDIVTLIRSMDLPDAATQASPDLKMALAMASDTVVFPAGIAPSPQHRGAAEEPDSTKDRLRQIGELLKEEAEEIAKDLLNEPLEHLIRDWLLLRYVPKKMKALFSDRKERTDTVREYFAPHWTGTGQPLRRPLDPERERMLAKLYELNQPFEGGSECGSSPLENQASGAAPESTANSARMRALEDEVASLRLQIAELKKAKQTENTVP